MLEKAITETKIRHLQLDQPLCVQAGTAVRDVLSRMREDRRSCVLICRGELCAGIFTERDFLTKILGRKIDPSRPVNEFMSPDPKTLTIEDTVGQAIAIMQEFGFRNIPLVDRAGNCAGLVQIRNIIDFLAELYPEEVLNVPPPASKFSEPDGA